MKSFESIAALTAVLITLVLQYVKAGCIPGTYGKDGDCKICPRDHYCPGESAQPLQCPPGFTSFDGEDECMPITDEEIQWRLRRNLFNCNSMPGWYSGGSCTECSDGYVCTGTGSQSQCPTGQRCPKASISENCPSGFYSPIGDDQCRICPAGSRCTGTPPADPVACLSGTYSLEGATSCTTCPVGSKCPTVNKAPILCAPGEYQVSGGQTGCNTCTAGRYWADTLSIGNVCGSGTYSLAGAVACTPCPAGYSCSSGVKGSACSAGFYSYEGDDSCVACPANKYCYNGEMPLTCPEGYYTNVAQTGCTACEVGYYCTGGIKTECKHLYYADEVGLSECKPVPKHWYANSKLAATTITECAINQYTDYMQLACYTWDDAHQCSRSDTVKPCPDGYVKLSGNWYCEPCPPGSICTISTTTGSTTATTITSYESGLSATEQNYPRYSGIAELGAKVCPPNNYCTDDGLNYFICPHGTFPYITGCSSCPDDKFCMTSFNRQVTPTTGSISKNGDSFPRFQPQNYYWNTNTYTQTQDFTSARTAKGRVLDTSVTAYEFACPQGYSCTHSIHARCPSTHQGLKSTGSVGAVKEDQNIRHNIGTLTGFTFSDVATGNLDDTVEQCFPCNAGYSCRLGADPVICAAGKFSPTGEYMCIDCPPGYYCPSGSAYPTACAANTYSTATGNTASGSCTTCATGFYSIAGSATCEPCPAGFECSTTPGTPVLCPIGKYSPEGTMTCDTCQTGYICDQGGKIKTPPESVCPKGSYCADNGSGSILQYKCPEGTYGIGEGVTSSASCITCPPGYVCRDGTDDFTKYPCPVGAYCPSGTIDPIECPAGTYNPETGAISVGYCKTWPAGYYCPIESSVITICPVGYYCPAGTPDIVACPAGTYSGTRTGARLQSDCFPCTIGHYCEEATETPELAPEGTYIPYLGATSSKAAIPCPPGYPCTDTGNYDYKGFTCTAGYYCPTGSTLSDGTPCPAGTYSDRTDLWSKDQCQTCPAGYFCEEASTSADQTTCTAGYYCPPGTGSGTQYPCPTGTFSNTAGLYSSTQCTNCTAGTSCGSGSTTTTTCDPGFYCPAGTTVSNPPEYQAPAGSFIGSQGATSEYENTPCGYGHYCPKGSTDFTKCPVGTYSDILRASTCKTWPAGYYWDVEEMRLPLKCPIGTYSTEGSSTCTACPEGYYCHQLGTTQDVMLTQKCPAGTICSSGGNGLDVSPNLVDHACPIGQYCKGGHHVSDCPAGTYNPIKGRKSIDDCLTTPAGFYTAAGASEYMSTECAAGYYCLEGSTTATEFSCPVGTFRGITGGRKPEDCAICKSGYVCASAATVTPADCGAGNYCPLGTVIPELCPIGTFSTNLNNPDSRSCTKCSPGFWCGTKGMTSVGTEDEKCDAGFLCIGGATRPDPTDGVTGKLCPAGGYCEKGATAITPCAAGTYNPEEGAQSATYCISCLPGKYCDSPINDQPTGLCDVGYYCTAGSNSKTQNSVAAGYYAPAGSDYAIPCPRGTYQNAPNKGSCTSCEAGAYCPNKAMTAADPCPAGYYCPSAASYGSTYYEAKACPVGTYNAIQSKTSLSDCLACPAGKYCETEGLSAFSGTCAAGYYCASNSPFEKPAVDDGSSRYGRCPIGKYCIADTSTPATCPAGTYSAITKAIDNSVCKSCEPGYYCATDGLGTSTGKCDAGYFCTGGATSATEDDCTVKNYCPQGSANPERCPIGYYNTAANQGKCTECEGGYTCVDGEKVDCPKGYFCP